MTTNADSNRVFRRFFGIVKSKIASITIRGKELKPVRILAQLLQLLHLSFKASRFYKRSSIRTFRRGLRLRLERDFKPYEAFQLGLFDPELPESELSKYCSRIRMTEVELSVNPRLWALLTEDKGQFYKHCMTIDVPIPKLYAIFFRSIAGWTYNEPVLKNRGAWNRFLETEIPSEFVLKPARGVYGQGIHVFSKSGKGFIDAFGKLYEANDLCELMLSYPQYDSFVIQERLKNHPELVRLSDTQALQTIRIITFVDSHAKPHILYASLKIIVGNNIIDNLAYGTTGNLWAAVSTTGILTSAVTLKPNCPGIVTVEKHPETGMVFDQFQLPLWDEASSLVKEVAVKFLPIRYVGWDVAITPSGINIVEGNMWADPPNWHKGLDDILARLSSDKQEE